MAVSRREFCTEIGAMGVAAATSKMWAADYEMVTQKETKMMSAVAGGSEAAQAFDPDKFLIVPARKFEDLRVGEVFRAPSRTLTDAHAAAFQTVSADNHPVHYDVEWAKKHGHSAPVVHGLQVLAFSAPGATLFPQYIGLCARKLPKSRR